MNIPVTLDNGDNWNSIYQNGAITDKNSSFSEFILGHVSKTTNIIDIGCGNARDTSFFLKTFDKVYGLDSSKTIMKKNIESFPDIKFYEMDISGLKTLPLKFDNIYSRFFLHAIPWDDALEMLKASYNLLEDGGLLFVECRSIFDPIFGKGEKGEKKNEWIHGHYRHFIDFTELLESLSQIGYDIKYSMQSNDLSKYKTSNPVLIRVVAEKNPTGDD